MKCKVTNVQLVCQHIILIMDQDSTPNSMANSMMDCEISSCFQEASVQCVHQQDYLEMCEYRV